METAVIVCEVWTEFVTVGSRGSCVAGGVF